MFAKAWEAFLNENVISFESIFLYESLVFLHYIEDNYEMIIESIKTKHIPETINLSNEIKEYILGLPVSNERLEYVKAECDKGFNNIVKRLWKNFKLISGIGNKRYLTEAQDINMYAPDVTRHNFIYGSTECHIGAPIAFNDYNYVMMPECAFFEFLPNGSVDGKTLMPDELTVGQEYEPIFTNFNGLYRYSLGDVVKITDYIGDSPVMEFRYRKGQALNIAGEKYNVNQLEKAFFELSNNGMKVSNYCVSVDFSSVPGRYVVAVVMDESVDTENITDKVLNDRVDAELRKFNADYDDLRNLKQISNVRVIRYNNNEFSNLMKSIGLIHDSGHNKAKHIYYGEASEEEWMKLKTE